MRGVRQGLPISLIRIEGIQIGDHEIKTINFAEDTTIFLLPVLTGYK